MTQSNIILDKPDAGIVEKYTISEGDSARINFEPSEIESYTIGDNGELVISFADAGQIHITNFEEFVEDGNLLYLADGTLIDPTGALNNIQTAAGDAGSSTDSASGTNSGSNTINKPGANTSQEVTVESGQKYVCNFDPSQATVETNENGQMVMTFADGSQIIINNYTEVAGETPAELTLADGNVIDTEALLTTVTDIQAPIEEVLEVAVAEPASEPEFDPSQLNNIETAAGGEDIAAQLNQIETAAGEGGPSGNSGYGFNSTAIDVPLNSPDAVGALGATQLAYVAPQLAPDQFFIQNDTPEIVPVSVGVDETTLTNGTITTTGNFPVDFGNDTQGATINTNGQSSYSCSVDNGVLSSAGVPIEINAVPGGGYEGIANGVLVFDFSIDNNGEFTYNQYEQIDHADTTDPDDIICLNFGVVATDGSGDPASTFIRVEVRDDAPNILSQTAAIVDETDSVGGNLTATGQFEANLGQDVTDGAYTVNNNFSATGSVDNGALTSNGSPVIVNFDAGTNTYIGTDANNNTVFTLELDPDTGAYVYNQFAPLDHADDNDANDEIVLNFGVDVTDFDGDTASGQISVIVRDDAPIVADAASGIDETDGLDTVNGSLNVDFGEDGAGSIAPSDSFTPGGSLAGGQLTSGGVAVNVTETPNGYVGTANGVPVFEIQIDPTTGDYSFTQFGPLDHADGTDPNDTITLTFGVNVSDFEGDTVPANIVISVADDAPILANATNNVDETNFTANGVLVGGIISIEGGTDGIQSIGPVNGANNFTPGGSLAGGQLTSGGVPVLVTATATGYIGTANGQPVFTLDIDPQTGEYTYAQTAPLDHADGSNPDDVITLGFAISVTDNDGDTAEATITINVADDGPTANDDVNTFDVGTGSTDGNVITGQNGGPSAADDLSTDDTNTVTQVEAPDGTIYDVPATGSVDVQGEFGVLTIESDGSYTYVLDPNAVGGPGGTGSLDPVAADVNGFQNSIMKEGITISSEGGQDLVWLDTPTVGSGIGIDGNGSSKVFGANEQLNIDLADGADTVAITLADLGSNNVGDTFSMDVFLASDPTTPIRVDFTIGNNADGTETFTINAADFGPDAEIIGVDLVGGVSYLLADVDVNYAGEPVSDEFIYTIQDGDGDTSTATLTLEGNPNPVGIIGMGSVDETDFVNGQTEQSGDIFVNFQGDTGTTSATNADSFVARGSVAGTQLTSNGVPVLVALVGNTYVGTANGQPVFEMTINDDATFDFILTAQLDHADGTDPNDAIQLDFGVLATDSDEDTGTGTVTVTVYDDAPEAADDTISVDEGGTASDNVLTNDDQGEDTAATVTSVTFEGNTVEVPANGQATVEGNSGTLTIESNGDYTYEANGEPSETIRVFEVTDPVGGDAAGNIESVSGSYNETTEELNFSFTVEGSDANGYTLVLNDGGNPKGHAGELAQFYFDNSGAEPIITVYGYNGLGGVPGTTASAFDGSEADGVQAPDTIATSLGADSPFSNIVVTTDANGNQTFSFTMDATDLNDHSPLYDVAGAEWNGVQFGDEVGAWFHPVTGLETSYNADGYLTQFDFDQRGGWDSAGIPTNEVNVFDKDNFTYEITDADGDTSTANLEVCVDADVGPTGIYGENSTDDTDVRIDGTDVAEGVISVNYNGDAEGTTTGNGTFIAKDNNLPNGQLSHEGTPIEVRFNETTNTYTGVAGNVTVFTMVINPDATYTFSQLESIDHSNTASRNETIFLQFGVTATDGDGDAGDGLVQIRVRDDWSNAINDNTSVSEGGESKGNVLDNDTIGADAETTVIKVEFDGQEYDVPATGTVTVQGEYGTLVLDANGEYTYTPADGNPEGSDDFNYTIVDGDGDTDTARFRVNVSSVDDKPVITTETSTVDETDGETTVGGTITVDYGSDEPGTLMGSDKFSADGSTGPKLTSCGEEVKVEYNAHTGTYTGTAHGEVIFTMTIDPSGSYEFTLLGAIDHADGSNPNDAINLNFGVKAVDGDGTVGETNVTITVLDDAPTVNLVSEIVSEVDLNDGGTIVGTGQVDFDYGRDGGDDGVTANGKFEAKFEAGGIPQDIKSGGSLITVALNGNTYEGKDATGALVFTMKIDGNGDYTYEQFKAIDHAPDGEGDDVMWLKFYVDVTDKDGDTVSTRWITVDVADDNPEANNDSGSVDEGKAVEGNLLDNDDVGPDQAGMVCEVKFGNTVVTVPATGTTTVQGEYGVLTIAANGDYTYNAASNTPGGADNFTYVMKDADGDTDEAILTITVLDTAKPISINGAGETDDTDLADDGMDMVSGTINVDYQGDGPGTTSAGNVDNFKASGNLTGGTLSHNGVEIEVTLNGNVYTGTAGNIEVFEMRINQNGTFKFTQFEALDHSNTNSANERIFLDFEVEAKDAQGDTGTGTVQITVRDDGPSIDRSVTGVNEINLKDGDLVVNKVIPHSFGEDGQGMIMPNGIVTTKFKVGGPAEVLKSGGEVVEIEQTTDGYIGTAGGETVFTLSIDAATGEYTYTQMEAIDHPGVGLTGTDDVIWLQLGVKIIDADGDIANSYVNIDIRDDAPDANDDTAVVKPDVETDMHCLDPDAHDVSGHSDNFTNDGITVTSNNGQDLVWVSTTDVGSGVGIAGDGTDKVFRNTEFLKVDFAPATAVAITLADMGANNIGGSFTYKVYLEGSSSPITETIIISANRVSDGEFEFEVDGYNSDITQIDLIGGPSFLLSNVKTTNIEVDSVDAQGNVLANDEVGADDPGTVTSVKFGNDNYDVPTNGTVDVQGDNGVLTIASDGSYTYVANPGEVQTVYSFNQNHPGGSDNAGDIKNVSGSYNDTTDELNFSFVIDGQDANGFTLVLNDGPNPKNHPGEMAMFYFDASTPGEPIISVYGYNGNNDQTSYRDGSSDNGTQAPDRILGSDDANNPFSNITVTTDANGNKVFSFSVDATDIVEHNPAYTEGGAEWTGASFDEVMGIWFHPVSGLETSYDAHGNLTSWSVDSQSWWDASNVQTDATTTVIGGAGDDEFTYTVTDADGDTDTATLSIDGDANVVVVGNTDQYFGTNDSDVFLFQAINDSAVTINDFRMADGDCLDLSALLQGQDDVSNAIDEFVFTTQVGDDTVISVDVDGAGGVGAQQVAVLDNVTGISAEDLLDNGNISV